MSEAILARPVRARLATTLVFLANGSGFGFWAGNIPGLKAQLDLSDGALGFALLAFAAGAIVAMPSSGFLAAKFGTRRMTIVAAALFAIGLSLPAQAGSLPVLMACALAVGAANGLCDVAMNAHGTLVERRWGTPIMSSYHAGFSLGGLAGAAGTGLLLAQGLSTPTCLLLGTLWVGALVAVSVAVGLGRGLGAADTPSQERGPALALPSRALVGIGVVVMLGMMVEGSVADWSGVFLMTVAGASVSGATMGYAALSVAMIAGRLAGDRVVLALGGRLVVRLGGILAACGIGLALLTADPVASSIGFAVAGLGLANIVPVGFSAAGSSRGVAPSVGVSMAATLGYAGFLVSPPIIGALSQAIGLREALLLLILAGVAIVALAGRVLPPRAAMKAPIQARASRAAT